MHAGTTSNSPIKEAKEFEPTLIRSNTSAAIQTFKDNKKSLRADSRRMEIERIEKENHQLARKIITM